MSNEEERRGMFTDRGGATQKKRGGAWSLTDQGKKSIAMSYIRRTLSLAAIHALSLLTGQAGIHGVGGA